MNWIQSYIFFPVKSESPGVIRHLLCYYSMYLWQRAQEHPSNTNLSANTRHEGCSVTGRRPCRRLKSSPALSMWLKRISRASRGGNRGENEGTVYGYTSQIMTSRTKWTNVEGIKRRITLSARNTFWIEISRK